MASLKLKKKKKRKCHPTLPLGSFILEFCLRPEASEDITKAKPQKETALRLYFRQGQGKDYTKVGE